MSILKDKTGSRKNPSKRHITSGRIEQNLQSIEMDEPKTRRESKKDSKTKNGEKYGQKHIRIVAAFRDKKNK